jgi:hypothetical protein
MLLQGKAHEHLGQQALVTFAVPPRNNILSYVNDPAYDTSSKR